MKFLKVDLRLEAVDSDGTYRLWVTVIEQTHVGLNFGNEVFNSYSQFQHDGYFLYSQYGLQGPYEDHLFVKGSNSELDSKSYRMFSDYKLALVTRQRVLRAVKAYNEKFKDVA